MKEHLENAVKPYFVEGYGPPILANAAIDSKIWKTSLFIASYQCIESQKNWF